MEYKLKEELIGNYVDGTQEIDINYLYDFERINSRAKTVENLYSFEEETTEIYLYDFLAYLLRSSKESINEEYDEYIWYLLKFVRDNDYVVLNKEVFDSLFNYSKYFSISSELKSLLFCMYVYNEAIIENNHQIDSPVYNLNSDKIAELQILNFRLLDEQKVLKDVLFYLSYKEFLNSKSLDNGTKPSRR